MILVRNRLARIGFCMDIGKKILEIKEDNWETELGAWFAGERVVLRGYDLFTELFDKNWVEIWYFSITGRFFSKNQIDLFSRLWVLCTSYPEPRIWNNRVAALTGSAKSTAMLGVSSAIAVSEGKFYGGQANFSAVEFIREAKREVIDKGVDLESFIKGYIKDFRGIPVGFGRPVINNDERVPHALRLAKELGFDQGEHVQLALAIEKKLAKLRYRSILNIGGLTAALCADQGLSAEEFYYAASVIYSAGMIACYSDAAHKQSGTFFPLRCSRISYEGKSRRKWEN